MKTLSSLYRHGLPRSSSKTIVMAPLLVKTSLCGVLDKANPSKKLVVKISIKVEEYLVSDCGVVERESTSVGR